MTDPAELYIELLKKSLMHSLYRGEDALGFPSVNPIKRWVISAMRRRGIVPVRLIESREDAREIGQYWPMFAQTMIGRKRLDSLHTCIDTVLEEEISGDLIETGVWRGGATIFMRGLLEARGVSDRLVWTPIGRLVWVADSFQGLPPPREDAYPADAGAIWHKADDLVVPLEEVKDNFRRYGLLDDQVRFLPGWFRDTLPTLSDRTFAVARLDGDMYESTIDALRNLYPRLAVGGFLIVDDYSIEACAQAVNDYRRENGIDEELEEVDWSGVLWRKRFERSAPPERTAGAGASDPR
jgi:O-methyltransferase